MGTRTYDIELACGCMVSLDKGGGLIPCVGSCFFIYPEDPNPPTEEEKIAHNKSWDEYRASTEYKEHQEEIKRRNG